MPTPAAFRTYTVTGSDGHAVTVPALDIDNRTGAASATGENLARLRLERRIVAALLAHLARKGWYCASLDDGEETTEFTTGNPSSMEHRKAVMELVFNLDDCLLHFKAVPARSEFTHWVRLVLGNGIDLISDYSYALEGVDDFGDVMEAFDPEVWA